MKGNNTIDATQKIPESIAEGRPVEKGHPKANPNDDQPKEKRRLFAGLNVKRVFLGAFMGCSILLNMVLIMAASWLAMLRKETILQHDEAIQYAIHIIKENKARSLENEDKKNEKEKVIARLKKEIAQSEKKAEEMLNHLKTRETLEELSKDGKENNKNLREMLQATQLSLEESKKQVEILGEANATLTEEIQRLKFIQNETTQSQGLGKNSARNEKDRMWSPWVSSEDISSYCREYVTNKNMLPLEIEGRVNGSGLSFRFFLIPNLYQLRWRVEWNLTDEALVRQISYHGKYKYYELSRQSFMVNRTSPRYQVIFVHSLDLDEAKRLKDKYLAQ